MRVFISIVIGAVLAAGVSCMPATHVDDEPMLPEQAEVVPQAQAPEISLSSEAGTDSSCDAIRADVRSLIRASKTCSVDKDCALFSPGCPFGCGDAVRASEISNIKAAYRDYAGKCGACAYMCPQPAFERWAACEQSECAIREKPAKALEQHTLKLSTTPDS